jgi:hypothetical protein
MDALLSSMAFTAPILANLVITHIVSVPITEFLTKSEHEALTLRAKHLLRHHVNCNFHCIDVHEAHNCRTASRVDLLYQISPKSV